MFTVEIPIAEECAEAPAVRVEPALPGPDGRRLLVVDDEEAIVELVVTYLGSRGWTVTAAKTAEEALELVAHDDFDVLLVDLLMPGMGGRAFYDELRRARPELAERVVFATGAAAEVAGGFLAAAEHPVLDKPFDLQALARTVIQVAGDSGQVH